MNYGFIRVGAITPKMRVADVTYNAAEITKQIEECAQKGVQLAVFPELSLSGYTCSDLFFQPVLTSACLTALQKIAEDTKQYAILSLIGLPLAAEGKLYNVAAAISSGKILAFIPKQNLPNYGEFYEQRHFSVLEDDELRYVTIGGEGIPFGNKILLRADNDENFSVGCEICEDLWTPISPSSALARGGATIIANLSASNEVIGKKEYRTTIVKAQSGKCVCGYVYASCGTGESTTDMIFAGHDLIAENGSILAESTLFSEENRTITEIDAEKLACERRKVTTFSFDTKGIHTVYFHTENKDGELIRTFPKTPFVPANKAELKERSELILSMQANALAKRLKHTGAKSAVIGISGGLDSTLALLVTAKAFDIIGKDKKGIIAITMPGFGTTGRTYQNAVSLIECVGATLKEVNITESVLQHFKDIGQDKDCYDVTYENSQARIRTLILMDTANKEGGMVVGTGDLSELALGWCTYNGDHMSMYAVNSSVPKTLVKYLVAAVGKRAGGKTEAVLQDILNTEISPELLPPDKEGNIAQKTEDLVGPYELHDFYLYHAIRWGFSPRKIFYIAKRTFADKYDGETLKKWLKNFYRRFFSQQFKRSCIPDGVKIGSVTLSPRADWRMPSDAQAALWLEEAEHCE